jgi:cyanophycin synthetase
MVPGRFNVNEVGGVQVILDYGHNAAALTALGEAVAALGQRRTVMLLALPGDRRDDDLRATVEATIPYVDEYVLYDLADRRGRAKNEVPRLLRGQLLAGTLCVYAANQADAMRKGWRRVHPGDRLILIVDKADEAIDGARALAEPVADDAACVAPIALERAVAG